MSLAPSSTGAAEWRGNRRLFLPVMRRGPIRSPLPTRGAAAIRPAMEEIRSGRRPFIRLDVLHLENLAATLSEFGIDPAVTAPSELEALNLAWRKLDPWPDSVSGLTRLRRRFIIAPLSNGNIRLMVDLAKRSGLPWDAILGAEIAQAYKPSPEAYLRNAEALMLEPESVCLVAAHNSDLAAARRCGFRTAFIPRPTEHGPNQITDLGPEEAWDAVTTDMEDLAGQLAL
jgi:2-haloacid dehalogenase